MHAPRDRDNSLPAADGSKTAAVLKTLTRPQARLVTEVLDEAERAIAAGRAVPKHPLKTPQWLRSLGLTDAKWRRVQSLPRGALEAAALARLMDRGTLISTFMTEIGVFPRHARMDDPEWVPDRVVLDDANVAVRGEISFCGLTCENELVRFVVVDLPLGKIANGAQCLEVLVAALREHVLDPATPLGALGLSDAPVYVRRGPTLGVAAGTAHVVKKVGIDQVAQLRHVLDDAGVRYAAQLEEDRSPLLADLAPIVVDRFGVRRTVGGPRVILRQDVVGRLQRRLFDDLDQHRYGMDDDALDGKSYLSVYPSGFGLPDEQGRYEAVAVCVYQLISADVHLIGGWDLRDPLQRQELATVVHYASDPDELDKVDICRKRARASVDAYRPAARGEKADVAAAELEHTLYLLARMDEMMGVRR
jgi:hypothetical protein